MNFKDYIINKAKERKMTIVLPEGSDSRVVEAAKASGEIANIIVLNDTPIVGLTVINPKDSDYSQDFIAKLYELRKDKGMSEDEAKDLILNNNMYFACMMILNGLADGIVSGASHSTADTLRPALQIIKAKKDSKLVSSFMVVDTVNKNLGYNGIFFFADCGINQNPTSEELAIIAKDTSDSFKSILNTDSMVAMLSHSTMGSAKHECVDKVRIATNIAKETYPDLLIDGEMQADAAIMESVARLKAPNSSIAGHANTLIFPTLDAGNIGYKLVERLGNASVYGPITQGLNKPVNDLSRGCNVNDIIVAIAITAVQAKGGN